jgi:predicted AlkP superfamily phosphohydrolase/phosphomutase
MAGSPGRLLIVGLELGDGHLIDRWAGAGMLPALAAMRAAGLWGELETPADSLHISAWPSLYTGAAPGEHGVYFTFQPAPGLQGYRRFHEGIYGRPTFWSLLDRGGRRCVVFDPPYSHAEPGFGGAFIHDWGTWAHYLEPGSVPDELLGSLEAACGCYPLGLEANDIGFRPLEAGDMARRLARSLEVKAGAAAWLMRNRPWDLFFTVFGETHAAGHYCWSAQLRGTHEDAAAPMFQVYSAVDRALAALRDAAGPECAVVVVSGDRCGPNFAGWHLLPEILARLCGTAAGAAETAAAPGGAARFDPVKALRDLLPPDFRKSLARRLPTRLRDKLAQRVDTAGIDWSRTRAYCLPTDLEGCIRVNLRGREPEGIVAPGDNYARLIRELRAGLLELRQGPSGAPLVRDVIVADDAFPGDRRPWLPDLVVQWHAAGPITAAASERIGVVRGESPDPRSGTHRGPGFVLADGPGVAGGATLRGAGILDFAPTVLARMGVARPQAMRGRVWPELAGS